MSLSYGKIKRKSIDATAGLLPESFDGYNIIERDDIVLRLTDLQNDHKSLRVGRTTERGIITSAYLFAHTRITIPNSYITICILLIFARAYMEWVPVFGNDVHRFGAFLESKNVKPLLYG